MELSVVLVGLNGYLLKWKFGQVPYILINSSLEKDFWKHGPHITEKNRKEHFIKSADSWALEEPN